MFGRRQRQRKTQISRAYAATTEAGEPVSSIERIAWQLDLSPEDMRHLAEYFRREAGHDFDTGSVYSDREIMAAHASGHIVIDPLLPGHVKGSSVDVTLGEWFYTTDRVGHQAYFDHRDPHDVARYFGEEPKRAQPYAQWSARNKGTRLAGLEPDDLIIVLAPHERVLAHTQEFIGIHAPGTSEMRARSTTGRIGVVVCKDAGWGDPGYINRWTMEIQNDNSESVVLRVGERIAQIVFHRTGPVDQPYGAIGKYQVGDDLAELKQAWHPRMMLPTAHLDRPDGRPDRLVVDDQLM